MLRVSKSLARHPFRATAIGTFLEGSTKPSFRGGKTLLPKHGISRVQPEKGKKRRKRSPLTIAKDNLEETQKELTIRRYGRDCYTCPQKNLTGMNCQLGHVPYPRAALSVKYIYDIRLTRMQCFSCNINKGGMGAVALDKMTQEGFDPRPLKKESDAAKGKPVPIQWFKDKREEYLKELSV